MALNSLVMKVNNLIERKNKREAIRAGKKIDVIISAANSKFSAQRNDVKSHSSSKRKVRENQTILNELDSMEEDLGFDEHEKQEREHLREIDNMYLINKSEDEELFIFRGIGNKAKRGSD